MESTRRFVRQALVYPFALLLLFVASESFAGSKVGGVFQDWTIYSGASGDAMAACQANPKIIGCQDYQITAPWTVAGNYTYASNCSGVDPWGLPTSGLDDDPYRQAVTGVDQNGTPTYEPDDTYYCYFYDHSSAAPATCPVGYQLTGGTCRKSDVPDAGQTAAGGSCPAAGAPQSFELTISNPINIGSGNKYQVESDYEGTGAFALSFARAYNSVDGLWRTSYSRRLNVANDSSGNPILVDVVRDNGLSYQFNDDYAGNWLTWDHVPLALTRNVALNQWTVTDAEDRVETYNAAGRLLSVVNRAGQTISFNYDGSNRLILVSDFNGRTLALTYDGSGRLASMTNPGGFVTTYAYDASSRLIQVSYPDATPADPLDNPKRSYLYENASFPKALTGITDENGVRSATWTFDAQGRAISSAHASGADSTTIAYNADGTVTATNAFGRTTSYTLAVIGGQPRITAVSGAPSTLCGATLEAATYDTHGFIASSTDPNGNVSTYTHDSRGLLASKTEASGTAIARTATTTWDATRHVPTQRVEPGRTTSYTYDASGRLLTETVTDTETQSVPYSTNGNARTSTYTYNAQGLVATIDGPRTNVADVTTVTYTAGGDLWKTTDALGRITEVVLREARGLPTRVKDPNGLNTDLVYDARGRLVSRTTLSSQGNAVTTFVYDALGQMTRVTLPDGTYLNYEYNSARRLVAVEDRLGQRIEYSVDSAGNRTAEAVKNGVGDVVQTVTRVFDELSRIHALTNGVNNTTLYTYDPNGNATSVTDAANRTSTNAYDALNRLVTVTDALNHPSSYQYDARDNLTQVIDPRGVTTNYVLDGLDNRIQEASPDAGTTVNAYDAAGNVISSTDARGVVTNSTYDALNRVTQVSYPADSTQNITYTYDQGTNGIGRLTGMTDVSGSTSYAYDDRGNIKTETRVIDGTTYVTQYSYDLADRLTAMTYPSGRVVSYARDALGQIASVMQTVASVQSAILSQVDHQPFGGTRLLKYGNSAYEVLSIDAAGRINQRLLTDDTANASTNIRPQAFPDTASTNAGVAVTIPVLGNDLDPNGGTLSIPTFTQGTFGAVTLISGQLKYTPNAGVQNTTDAFTYRISDGALTSNLATVTVSVTAPAIVDNDHDGMADDWETQYGFNPNSAADATLDPDGDGVTNLAEYNQGSDPLVNPAGYAAAVLAAAPVGYWRLNDTNTTLLDASAGAHNGTYYGTYTQQRPSLVQTGTSVGFTAGRAQIASFTAANATGNYTVEFFLRYTGVDQGNVFTKRSSSTGAGPNIRTNTDAESSTKPGVLVFQDGWYSSYALVTNTKTPNDGRWRHYAFVRRGNTLEIWINGVLDASRTIASAVAITGTDPLIAMGLNSPYAYVNGTMDELAYYASALTPSQIRAHFQSQTTDTDGDGMPNPYELVEYFDPFDAADAVADTDGDGYSNIDEYLQQSDPFVNPAGYRASILADTPVGYWPLDDANTTAVDLSGFGRNGTYTPSYTQLVTGAITAGSAVTMPNSGYVNVAHNAAFNMAGDYAIELYMRWSTWQMGSVFSKASSAVGPQVVTNYPSEGMVGLIQNGWSTQLIGSNSTAMNTNTWRHFVFIRRGTQLEIWINGRLDNSVTASVLAFTNTAPLQIGNGQYKVNGTLDEVVFYNHSLTPLDVLQHYRQSLIPTQASVERPSGDTLYASNGTTTAGTNSPVLVSDIRYADPSLWMYDPTAQPALQTVADLGRVDLGHFNSLIQVDGLGIDRFERRADVRGEYVYERIPNGARTGLINVTGGSLNEMWTYAYDVVSNITSITKPGGVESFGYDALDRLNAYTLPSEAQVTYGYDFDGNRLSETQSGVTVNHTYGTTSNRQLTAAGAAIGYDANGNRASDTGGTRAFSYDVRNRLRQAVANSVTVGTYTINALGQRVRKVAGSSDVDYVYDLNGKLIGEYANGTLISEYVYLDNLPVAQIAAGGAVTYLHPDHLGTPRSATNSNAQIVWRWDSDPFGKATPNQDPDGDLTNVTVNLRFPGQYFDMETGLNYNYFRDYDANVGRYVQRDPIGLVGGINLYPYGRGNPLGRIDPLGLYDVTFSGGFHLPFAPLLAVGPVLSYSVKDYSSNPHNPLVSNPIVPDIAFGVIADFGFSAGVSDLSNSGGACAGYTVNIGAGRYSGAQFTFRRSQDRTRSIFDPLRYLDGVSVGLGSGFATPVSVSRGP